MIKNGNKGMDTRNRPTAWSEGRGGGLMKGGEGIKEHACAHTHT